MTTQSDPAVASKGAAALTSVSKTAASGLVPPGGAYFGTLQVVSRNAPQIGPVPSDCNSGTGSYQIVDWQVIDDYFVYWQNGSPSAAGSYVIIQKETATFSIGSQSVGGTLHQGYLMSYAQTTTNVLPSQSSDPSAVVTLTATSPTAGDTYASVNVDMTLNVFVSGSGSQPQHFTATDQAALNLTEWAVQNQQQPIELIAQWGFGQTSPWVATVDGSMPPNWTDLAFNNGTCVPFTAISGSSLSTTTYAVWNISDPAWTQIAPPVYSIVAPQTFVGFYFLVWASGGSNSNTPGYSIANSLGYGSMDVLQLDKIAVKTPAGS
jgi:hypothetical protein